MTHRLVLAQLALWALLNARPGDDRSESWWWVALVFFAASSVWSIWDAQRQDGATKAAP